MELTFTIQKIKPKKNLETKLTNLDISPFVHRIFAQIRFLKPNGDYTIPFKAIIDTGAILSLFPSPILKLFPQIKTQDHTLWGIVDTPECQIHAKITQVPLILVDINGKESSTIHITAAFTDNSNTPFLLGMKDLLATYPSSIDINNQIFTLTLPDDTR